MSFPDRDTMAARSGSVPSCAMRGMLWALLVFSACLNPRPEELPSAEGGAISVDNSPDTAGNSEGHPDHQSPGRDTGLDGLVDEDPADPGEGPGPGLNDGELAPDAGADAGTLSIESTGPEGSGPEGEPLP